VLGGNDERSRGAKAECSSVNLVKTMNMEAQMRMDEVNKLKPGLYYLNWEGGGGSLAVVGLLPDGTRWFAPCDRIGETLVFRSPYHSCSESEMRTSEPKPH
jgi:hypothetical protein